MVVVSSKLIDVTSGRSLQKTACAGNGSYMQVLSLQKGDEKTSQMAEKRNKISTAEVQTQKRSLSGG